MRFRETTLLDLLAILSSENAIYQGSDSSSSSFNGENSSDDVADTFQNHFDAKLHWTETVSASYG